MKTYLPLTIALCMVFFMPFYNFAQTVPLGTTSPFALFTAVGAFSNDGATMVTGDIGTDVGAFSGFPPGVVIGSIHVTDMISAQAALDVALAYSYLGGITCGQVIGTTLGSGQTLTPDVYCLGAASVLNGELILDGQCDPEAFFIFKIDGALSTAVLSSVTLTNGASLCNVYWQVNGAVALGEGSVFRGTIVAGGAESNHVTVAVNPLPDCIITGVFTVCAGQTTELCTPAGYTAYAWSTGATINCITVSAGGTYTVTVTDVEGCTSVCSQIVAISDLTPPDITCPINVTIECDASTLPAGTGVATAIDDCDPIPAIDYADITTAGPCAQAYTITRTWTATDASGNTGTCIQTINVEDTTPPVITCPVVVSPIECGTTPSFGFAIAIDACDATVAFTIVTDTLPGTCGQSYTLTRTWTASDDCGNTSTCGATIVVEDNTAPVITCPVNVTAFCNISTAPSSTGTATAIDNCDGSPVISFIDFLEQGICPMILTRTWTATDQCGNTSTCVQTIEVTDNTPPLLTCAPVFSPVECGTAPVFGAPEVTDDCDPSVVVTFVTDSIPGTCNQSYTLTRTWTATDDCDNTTTCSRTINVEDNTAPVITCPVVVSPIECGGTPSFGTPVVTDACDATVGLTFVDVSVAGQCPQEYSVTRTWTATDDCGNASTCSRTILVQDNTPPVLSCPTPVSPIECGSLPSFGIATATDACDTLVDVTFSDITFQGLCPQEYSVTRTWIATDDCGNSSSCFSTILIQDNAAPVITCPIVVSPIECGSVPAFGLATAIDACDVMVDVTFSDITVQGLCPQEYTVTRTWTATDDCGNTATCNATVVVQDNTAPVISCPPVISPIECGTTPSFGTATATDLCDAAVAVTFTELTVAGTCPQEYSITRIWTATDDCGNTATCASTITIADNTAPVITCPTGINTIECGTPLSFGTPTVTDACDAAVEVIFADVSVSGLCPQEYSVTRTWTATDDCGNTATCSRTINIEDNTPPVITCPVVVSPVECGATISFGTPVVTDACDALVLATFADISVAGSCPQEYSVTRTWTAVDDCGNASTCSSTILVQDNTPPLISCPLVTSPIECGSVPAFGLATATDACDALVDVIFSDITVQGLCPQEYSITRTWIASDDCGNSSSCSATILVQDNTAPLITCPVVVSPIDCGSVPDFGLATATDLCDALVAVTFSDVTVQGLCAQEYTVTRTWVATDDCGNASSCSRIIVVGGSTGLVIECPPALTVQCAEEVPVPDISLVVVSGICGALTVSHIGDVITNQTCLNNFTLTRTYQALDVCGNVATCTQIITVLDTIPPSISFINPLFGVEGDTMQVQCYGQDPEWDIPSFNAGSVTTTDSCGGEVNLLYSRVLVDEGNCSADGYINLYRLTWTATDVCGNSSSTFIFMALVDTIPPVIHDVPDDITVNCTDVPLPATVYATDECLCACIVLFQETDRIMQNCQDGLVLIRTWTAVDRCGNQIIDTQRITLIDQEGPALQLMEAELAGISSGTVLEYTCNEGGIPAYYDLLDAESVFSEGSCGGQAVIAFSEHTTMTDNCEFSGYLEQRIYEWTGTDPCGNTTDLTLIVRLIDNEAPVLSGVPDTTCIGDPALKDIIAMDNCDHVSVRYWDVKIPNPCGTGSAVRRTYEAYDHCGNMAVDTSILLPNSQTAPVISFIDPAMNLIESVLDMTINCAANGGQYTTFGIGDVTVSGACQEGSTVRFAETVLSSGDCASTGTVAFLELKWSATDVCGNYGERILIARIVDHSAPVFVDFIPVLSIGCHDSIPVMEATDNCGDVIMTAVDKVIPGLCEYEYDIERTITATDPCNNVTVLHQIIHVGNGGGPVITGVVEEICDDLTIPVVTAYDACADQFVEVTMTQDTLDITCRDGLVIERTWTATDACGHTTVIRQHIIVHDETPPEIYIPSYSVIHLFIEKDHNIVYQSQTDILEALEDLSDVSVAVYDDCDQLIIPVLTVDTTYALDCEAAGYAMRLEYTWVATDICGNADSISITVDIMDDVSPVFMEIPSDTIIICAPLPPAAEMEMMDSLEAVSISYTQVMVAGPGAGQYTITRTWIATDSCNNVTHTVQTILWQPESTLECSIIVPDLIECNSHGIEINSAVVGGAGPYTYEWRIVGEKCFLQAGQGTPDISIYMGWADVKVILTVTDTFGCVTMCMTFLHCIDQADVPLTILPVTVLDATPVEHSAVPVLSIQGNELATALSQVTLWPNPAGDEVSVSFQSGADGIVEYAFVNFLGKTMLHDKINITRGINTARVDASGLANGAYLLQLKTASQLYTGV
ncbi:MAG: DUF3494 domain-containing protein [Saprospiraceae bacterium]|nr:DUF3494 domain-containing protein [Candidatus Opimibacter iunctus]